MNLPNMKEARKRTDDKVKTIYFTLDDQYKQVGVNQTYYIKTYGCQMNEHDSENISAILELMGYTKASKMETANLILLNTCAIRENAHNKVFGMLGRIKHLKETRPNIVVGLCGCMAQEEHVANLLKDKYKWMDLVFGTHNLNELPHILVSAIKEKTVQIEVFSHEGDIIEHMPALNNNKYKAWVNIMYGCDKFCTYCIVPFTRGKQRSRKPEDIILEVNNLKNSGYQEVTLLGQNVNAYGKDLTDINYGMTNLLSDIAHTGISRIRFVTSHPWDFTDDMIETISQYSNIMPYIHLPVQSGSNTILKLMGRRYTKEQYIELFNKIKTKIKPCSITTDIIVGFPNESDDDFNETMDLVNTCQFDSAFTFIYSPRVGTPAALMEDNIPLSIKNKRLAILNEAINKYALEHNKSLLNQEVSVLIEGESAKKGVLMGYTDTMKLVNVTAERKYIGKIIRVKITDSKTWSLDGEIIND